MAKKTKKKPVKKRPVKKGVCLDGDPIGLKSLDFTEVWKVPASIPDDISIINSNPHSVEPLIYRSYDTGRKVIQSRYCPEEGEEIPYFEVEDHLNGYISFGYLDEEKQRIGLDALDNLIKAVKLMDAVNENNIFGDSWHVDNKGNIGSFNKLLQLISEGVKNK